jgi:hypothetical protein
MNNQAPGAQRPNQVCRQPLRPGSSLVIGHSFPCCGIIRLGSFVLALGLLWLGVAVQSARGFALLGTKEAYQADDLGYGRVDEIFYPNTEWFIYGPEWSFAPHNLGEGYRWSIPTLYYTYDPSFLDYFGSNGVVAVDQAFAILNSLKNVSDYSPDLSEVPLEESRVNYTARALHLFDLKSAALEMLATRIGLADPERWTWTVRTRISPPGTACPVFDDTVVHRNFDPVTFNPSSYVNGQLFTYHIFQECTPLHTDAIEDLVDPSPIRLTAVASAKITFPSVTYYGTFHTRLTRDDIGGLRYLYRTNNLNVEQAPPDAQLFQTNFTQQLLSTADLNTLATAAATNNAGTLAALFPGLVVISSSNYFANVAVTNQIGYFTNYPTDPVGTAPHLVLANVVTTNIVQFFRHTVGNVVTRYTLVTNVVFGVTNVLQVSTTNPALDAFSQGQVTVITTNITSCTFAPPGVLCTNVSQTTFLTNILMGEYYIIPPGFCDVAIVATQLTTVVPNFNTFLIATNASGTNGQQFSQTLVTFFTNHIFAIYPISCVPSSVGLRGGLEKLNFVRRDFESLLNPVFPPITNFYSMVAVSNNTRFLQRFQRVVTRPDIIIRATDVIAAPEVETVNRANAVTFNASQAPAGLAGPGTIEGPFTLTFNKLAPIRLNSSPAFVTEANSFLFFTWASFDGSTNAPILYPTGTSLNDLESQVVIQVSPSALPPGAAGANYNIVLSVSGGSPSYSWSPGPNSPALPPGLNLTQDPGNTARAFLSGVPSASGTYNFWIRVTDAGGRFIDQSYFLQIN